ncbi:MAG: CHAD domain-containing protein [Actinomycetota bacterium]|nr:CHAD domain-containing protein [Actinomycetota bacterium]
MGDAQVGEGVDDDETLRDGVAKTYGRGRDALAQSLRCGDPELHHEWRKRAKYTWYHVRLLDDAAPSLLGPLEERFHDLSDALGDAHDLHVLATGLDGDPSGHGGRELVDGVLVVVHGVYDELIRRATSLGRRLYVEEPDAFADRLVSYRRVWSDAGDERDVGELAAVT